METLAVATGTGAFIGSIFGMNLLSGLEEHPAAFYYVFSATATHSCPEALLRIKKFTRTETYTGSLYDTWGVLKIFFKTFQLGNFEKSTNLCFPYAKLGAKLEENGHF